MLNDRALRALQAVLPAGTPVTVATQLDRDAVIDVAGRRLSLRWLPVGWPRQVKEALSREPRPDIVAAPLLSPGARELARRHGVGWLDESGAAEISQGLLLISRSGEPSVSLDTRLGWRPATLAVCEVLLTGCSATVSAVTGQTGLAESTVVDALKFLEHNELLAARSARGPLSGRYVRDSEALTDAYAAAAARLRSPISLRVGALWRDPLEALTRIGKLWQAAGIHWAVTSALAASVMAPLLNEPTPMEVYITGDVMGDLRRSALIAGLREIGGGRILLRPFPTPAAERMSQEIRPGFFSVLWPRAYADLRIVGVRGEEAAEHLREEEIARAKKRATEVSGGTERR